MAREYAINGNAGRSVAEAGDAPPPSTIAAQIVHNHTNANSYKRPQVKATFSQLLEEIRADPSVLERDYESNWKLVSVISEAALDVLTKEDPFAQYDELVAQAIASLDVIDIACKRIPDILFYDGEGTEGSGSEMFLWLPAKIIHAASAHDSTEIAKRAESLLLDFCKTLSRNPSKLKHATKLFRLYQSYATDVLHTLGGCRPNSLGSLDCSVPATATRTLFSPESHKSLALSRKLQCQLHSLDHAVVFVAVCIQVVSDAARLQSFGAGARLHVKVTPWLVNAILQLLDCLKRLSSSISEDVMCRTLSTILRTWNISIRDTKLSPIGDERIQVWTCGLDTLLFIAKITSPSTITQLQSEIGVSQFILLQSFDVLPLQLHDQAKEILSAFDPSWSQQSYPLEHVMPMGDKAAMGTAQTRRQSRNLSGNNSVLRRQSFDNSSNETNEERPTKKSRMSATDDAFEATKAPLDEFCLLMGNWDQHRLDELPAYLVGLFTDLDEPSKVKALELLARISCNRDHDGERTDCLCELNANSKQISDRNPWTDRDLANIYALLETLSSSNEILYSRKLKFLLIVATTRFLWHTTSEKHLDLETSHLSKWCLQNLKSSRRESRLATLQAIPVLIRSRCVLSPETCQRNRVLVIQLLRQMSSIKNTKYNEVSVLAFGQWAVTCEDEDIRLALVALVEMLGHTNQLVYDLAQIEISQVAQILNVSVEDLFRAHWGTVGWCVIEELPSKPQKLQLMSDLLNLSANKFLMLIQTDVLPYLVLWKKHDTLQRFANARGNEASVWDLCMETRNRAAILAHLIAGDPPNLEASIMTSLQQVSSDFEHEDVASMLKIDPSAVACEVLKLAGAQVGERRDRILHGFREFTCIVERKGHQTNTSTTKARMAALFFEANTLGIMTSFAQTIENTSSPVSEKKRCLRGLSAMIAMAQTSLNVALMQIRSCLQSALEVKELIDQAVDCWCAVVYVQKTEDDQEDVMTLVAQLFATLTKHWDTLSAVTQNRAHDVVGRVLQTHSQFIQSYPEVVPSLASIPVMAKFESELSRLKAGGGIPTMLRGFAERCQDESASVVLQALHELEPFLEDKQQWVQESASSEQPDPALSDLVRSLLNLCSAPKDNQEILTLTTRCLGAIGSLDASRIEVHRAQNDMLVLSNFELTTEIVKFISFILQHKLIKIFQSMSNPRAQGFLAYAMQELLKFGGFRKEKTSPFRPHGTAEDEVYQAWMEMPDSARNSLDPLLTSHYVLTVQGQKKAEPLTFPYWVSSMSHGAWLRGVVSDLLQRTNGDNAKQIFGVLSRVIRYDIAIASFLFPFAAANIIIGGTEDDIASLSFEFLKVLEDPLQGKSNTEVESLKKCSEDVLQVLDYLSRWLQEKRKQVSAAKSLAARGGQARSEFEELTDDAQMASVERIFQAIPADVMSRRAVDCGSYAMALLHWEDYIRQKKGKVVFEPETQEDDALLQRLQQIYSQIDELDGVEGILAHMRILTDEQQVMEHRKARRWAAAQSWYDLKLLEEPDNMDLQADLLTCLRDAGQLNVLLEKTKNFALPLSSKVLSLATEAAWSTERWADLSTLLRPLQSSAQSEFNPMLGKALLLFRENELEDAEVLLADLQSTVGRSMSVSTTSSLQACHEQMVRLHALYEVGLIFNTRASTVATRTELQKTLARRLDVLGTNILDKQFLTGIRRATMQALSSTFNPHDIRSLWMETIKLARKNDQPNIAYDAVLHAWKLGDPSAKVEQARLLWKAGSHRKAIQSLQAIIDSGILERSEPGSPSELLDARASFSVTAPATSGAHTTNMAVARAHLLLAKWFDQASQSTTVDVNYQYQLATKAFSRWEKGLYHLGKFYLKVFESERALPPAKQTSRYLSGETAKLTIENYLRSLCFGRKYMFQTLPKLLTLWLDFGQEIEHEISKSVPNDVKEKAAAQRQKMLSAMNSQVKKYTSKIPSWMFYTALAQMISRIGHKNKPVYDVLFGIITKVVATHPQQGLWSLFAVMKSTSSERAARGYTLINKVRERKSYARNENQSLDAKNLIIQGQKLSEALLQACEVSIEGKTSMISLSRDLRFNLKHAPCALVIPVDQTLSASLPAIRDHGGVRSHRAFPASRDAVTIQSFADQVLVLNSLQKPRKITVTGSDGNKYGLLLKPNDDLRKDQRLMEFNSMINRALQAHAPAAKRRLYIKTYAVTPLNEACGIIEWVEGLKPLRDILIYSYRSKGFRIDYNLMRSLLDDACNANDTKIFTDRVLPMYKPALHEWFTDLFPASESWFAARQRYTRSCAVASMVGYALGLGDRHGENVLLEESTGGVFHVDFNCLFDKGLTFEKPEMVPFRLTHNMVDAFGPSGVEGPFRASAELTCKIMRTNLDALLTILETFVYDPTSDFLNAGGARRKTVKGVPETPKEVLDSVRAKVQGYIRGDAVPLGVEGMVDTLIRHATDPMNLMRMYIGWCAFL